VACPRFFAPGVDVASALVTLPPDEAHHLTHVLRLGVGADVVVFNGRGAEWAGRVLSVGRREVRVECLSSLTPLAEPPVDVTVAVGVLKADQMDAVVRDATMLGAWAIVPMTTDHVAVPARARIAATARWHRVAVASAKQCRRSVVPTIDPLTPFGDLVARETFDLKLICVEPGHRAADRGWVATAGAARPQTALLLVGPEGGWSEAEADWATRLGVRPFHLGPRTLRAEAAPTVSLTALWTAWGW